MTLSARLREPDRLRPARRLRVNYRGTVPLNLLLMTVSLVEEVGGDMFSATATLESAEGAAGSWKVIDDADADVMTLSAACILSCHPSRCRGG